MSRLRQERVRDVVADALIAHFGDNADRFEEDPMRWGVVFDDGSFVEVKVLLRAPRDASSTEEADRG